MLRLQRGDIVRIFGLRTQIRSQVPLRNLTGKIAHSLNQVRPLRHTDGSSSVKNVECMRALQAVVISREHQASLNQSKGFQFKLYKQFKMQIYVRLFKIV